MRPEARTRWRLGWLLVGLLGLVVWPWLPDDDGQQASPAIEDRQAWLDALWQARPMEIERMLEAGAPVAGEVGPMGSSPLHVLFAGDACRLDQRPSSEAVKQSLALLLEAGAPVSVRDARGNTPLSLAVSHCDGEVIRRLLQAGADPRQENGRGLTPFELTLVNGNDAAAVLLEAGYRLSPEKYAHYRRLYHDEPRILERLERARPGGDRPDGP